MKASKTQQKRAFKPLNIEQENAIDLLIIGKTDQETADLVGVSRMTVQGWRTSHPLFMGELEVRRARLWGATGERLRGLMAKAVDNIAAAIEGGNLPASWELLKCTAMYGGVVNALRERDPHKILKAQAEAQVEAEGIPKDATDRFLIELSENAAYRHRVQEIEGELWAAYGEGSE